LELPAEWLTAYPIAYQALQGQVKLLLTTYFDSIGHNLETIKSLPVQGLHVDLVAGQDDIAQLHESLPKEWVLSLGVINGRNVWRADLTAKHQLIKPLVGS
ncbi:5-methyltetrahydropteroyltriglutamate--homocysteine S-methyltransferase, partial [Enterobacter hormaechei]|nr:5-methyltetrahydropteroyltriglutamate--homocysteine S-methyltransferase [Enterobacter hormaechei]